MSNDVCVFLPDVTIGKASKGINFSAKDSSGVETGEINLSVDAFNNLGMLFHRLSLDI